MSHRSTSGHNSRSSALRPRRRGLTLVELLVVSAVMVLLAGTLAVLSSAVQVSNEHHQGRGTAVQHGRVAIQRMERALNEATANEAFPGFLVFSESLGGWQYPDTLVAWHPQGTAAQPDGLPRIHELVLFFPNPAAPNQLLEARRPSDTREVPPPHDSTQWSTLITLFKSDTATDRAEITDLLRVATATDAAGNELGDRGCIRFDAALRPTEAEWAEYKSGSRDWEDISWVQSIHGSATGLRQARCQMELQLRPADVTSNHRQIAIPFFGTGAVYYELRR